MAPEADAFTFTQIAEHAGADSVEADYFDTGAEDIPADLRAATSEMDELQVSTGSRILFITPARGRGRMTSSPSPSGGRSSTRTWSRAAW